MQMARLRLYVNGQFVRQSRAPIHVGPMRASALRLQPSFRVCLGAMPVDITAELTALTSSRSADDLLARETLYGFEDSGMHGKLFADAVGGIDGHISQVMVNSPAASPDDILGIFARGPQGIETLRQEQAASDLNLQLSCMHYILASQLHGVKQEVQVIQGAVKCANALLASSQEHHFAMGTQLFTRVLLQAYEGCAKPAIEGCTMDALATKIVTLLVASSPPIPTPWSRVLALADVGRHVATRSPAAFAAYLDGVTAAHAAVRTFSVSLLPRATAASSLRTETDVLAAQWHEQLRALAAVTPAANLQSSEQSAALFLAWTLMSAGDTGSMYVGRAVEVDVEACSSTPLVTTGNNSTYSSRKIRLLSVTPSFVNWKAVGILGEAAINSDATLQWKKDSAPSTSSSAAIGHIVGVLHGEAIIQLQVTTNHGASDDDVMHASAVHWGFCRSKTRGGDTPTDAFDDINLSALRNAGALHSRGTLTQGRLLCKVPFDKIRCAESPPLSAAIQPQQQAALLTLLLSMLPRCFHSTDPVLCSSPCEATQVLLLDDLLSRAREQLVCSLQMEMDPSPEHLAALKLDAALCERGAFHVVETGVVGTRPPSPRGSHGHQRTSTCTAKAYFLRRDHCVQRCRAGH
jgi:hypothetical protein